jgi:hypothetical protein
VEPGRRDRGVARQVHLAGIAIDLDLDDMSAVREGHPFASPSVISVERIFGLTGNRRYPEQIDRTVGARHDKATVLEADIGLGRLKRLGSDALALLDNVVGGVPNRLDGGFLCEAGASAQR